MLYTLKISRSHKAIFSLANLLNAFELWRKLRSHGTCIISQALAAAQLFFLEQLHHVFQRMWHELTNASATKALQNQLWRSCFS